LYFFHQLHRGRPALIATRLSRRAFGYVVATKNIVPTDTVDIFAIAVVRSRRENYRPPRPVQPARTVSKPRPLTPRNPGASPTARMLNQTPGKRLRFHCSQRLYWTWKSRWRQCGRPPIAPELRALIRTMSRDNVGWGAPRIHGELQMLSIHVCQATVAKYMAHHPKPPSQT
jgi:hypothetical protein